MTENSATYPTEWLPLPDVAERLDVSVGQVRKLIEDDVLVASRRDGVQKVPSVFLQGAEPLSSLRGTVTVLHDVGLSTDEAIDWLLNYEDALGNAPIESLLAGRKAEVRRVAAIL
ncbi:Rv2175c family DNA-binding protein [Microbacterium halophytorum]|uniref:Rv2175c family DNA-binding protein n=1 Tax=Microbacterium halophytorum TaxID=2067568 RepID=UPI000CFDBE26|nr:Rv2175c family DNA-binding protein [Microbacterium halophytorum]